MSFGTKGCMYNCGDTCTGECMKQDEESHSPYCPICDACGEDGCCSATACQQHPDGSYCQTYLMELQFGYRMYHQLMKLIDGDEKYKEQVDKIWNETYDNTFKSEQDDEQN